MNTHEGNHGERGQVLAIFALGLVAIVAMTGLVLDGGSTFVQRRDMQNVADAAAMAGAYDYVNNGSASSAVAAAKAAAVANGYTEGAAGVVIDVVVDEDPVGTTVQVSVGKPHRNHFSGIVGMPTWDVSTTATAITGYPNSAVGAAPLIFNEAAFPGNSPNSQDQAYSEPGTGNEDVPQEADQFNWTVYCTANGNPCNANTNQVDDLINGTNTNENVVYVDETDVGPLNAGAHAALFSSLANLVGGKPFPVAIVDDDGVLKGIAMFKLTGSVGGSTKQIRGYFLTPYSGSQLRIDRNGVPGTSNFGTYVVQLID